MKLSIYFLMGSIFLAACADRDSFAQFVEKEGTQYDMLISGGRVIDGRGSPSYQSDILIDGDEIKYIGKIDTLKIQVDTVIRAESKLICPGFIDLHAHGNPIDQDFTNFLAMGVTTIVLGQDGYSPEASDPETSNIGEWMVKLKAHKPLVNVAMLSGHANLRRLAGIPDTMAATSEEINQLLTHLESALAAGCFGISTGIEYVPGLYADENELVALAKVVGKANGIMMSHVRNEDDDAIEQSLDELLKLGSHCRVHVSHIKSVYGKGASRGKEILALLKAEADAPVTADVYPYLASYTGIGIVFPIWAKTRGQFENSLLTRRDELRDYLQSKITQRNGPEATLFGTGPFAGKTLRDLELESGRNYVDILLDIGPGGASGAYFIMDEELQNEFIVDPRIAISTDGSPTMFHPRGYGTYARIIQKYVIAERKISMESAIYKMTGRPAGILGLKDRGILAPGAKADLIVFDPYDVQEKATYLEPHQLAEGFDVVILNGKLVKDKNDISKNRNGILLKRAN